jgi:hypothetical protein
MIVVSDVSDLRSSQANGCGTPQSGDLPSYAWKGLLDLILASCSLVEARFIPFLLLNISGNCANPATKTLYTRLEKGFCQI